MPRASKNQRERNRAAIVAAASRLYRERGSRSVAVSELMGSVGMTNGAFYSQFDSRDELAALACDEAFESANAKWRARIAGAKERGQLFEEYVRGYLSTAERDDLGGGCAAAALAGGLARAEANELERQAFVQGLHGMIDNVNTLQQSARPESNDDQALVTVATLVGALMLSRATRASELSEAILDVVRQHLLDPDLPSA